MKKLLTAAITAFLIACAGSTGTLPMPDNYFLLCAQNKTSGHIVDVRAFGERGTQLKTFYDLAVGDSECARVSFTQVNGVLTAAFQGQGTRWYVPETTKGVFIGEARGALITAAQEGEELFAHSWIDPY